MFSCEFSKIFKNSFFTEHLWRTAQMFLAIYLGYIRVIKKQW